MKKIFILTLILLIFSLIFVRDSFAIYDPTSVPNNKFGIHILFPDEISEAANLINSNGGDWGYVTIPIRDSERDLIKWQKFMDDCKRLHIIPILRIATEGDYFVKSSWQIPSDYFVIDFANFLNSLNWPTKNRYVVIFNETNRGDEWGGTPDPVAYANILNDAVTIFKERSDKFFVIMGGLDNASVDINGVSVNHLDYLRQMNQAVPGIFGKIDGLAEHSYPNPGFSQTPQYLGTNGIYSFNYELEVTKDLGGKDLPVFITETGWSSDTTPLDTQVQYYKQAFSQAWNNKQIIAVTPFLFHAETQPFKQFSFITENQKNNLYKGYQSMAKQKGAPQIEPETLQTITKSVQIKTKQFGDVFTKTIYNKLNNQTTAFFKWLLNY